MRISDWSSDVCSSDLADLPAYLRYNVADPVRLELLRKRSLLLDILPLAVAKGAVDVGGAAGRERPNFREVDARLMAGVAEHGVRLAALEHHHLGALQLAPGEIGIGLATGKDEAVHLVHLGVVHRRRDEALDPRREGLSRH